MKILVTGCAGFIGSNLTERLLQLSHTVVGIDNFNDFYDPRIKQKNIEASLESANFKLFRNDILDIQKMRSIVKDESVDTIIHLAARAGVLPSIEDPLLYSQDNVQGTVNLLKIAADNNIRQFIFGSSSSVYGNSTSIPFGEEDRCTNIIAPYGASKRAAEIWIEAFHKSYGLKCTILRFFTVYGPRGRVDMAPALFMKALSSNYTIHQYGNGKSARDYTFIKDIEEGIIKAIEKPYDFEIINLGSSNPVTLTEFIQIVAQVAGKNARINKISSQPGDVEKTWASIAKAAKLLSWKPKTSIEDGMKLYYAWLKQQ